MFIPIIDSQDLISPQMQPSAPAPNEADAKRAAMQFEAILLQQLTASLNPSSDEEEEGMFSGGSMQLYRQMFSEQMATTMSKSGGIGVADLMMAQMRPPGAVKSTTKNNLERAIETARSVRGDSRPAPTDSPVTDSISSHPMFNVSARDSVSTPSPAVVKNDDRYLDAVIVGESSPREAAPLISNSRRNIQLKNSVENVPLTSDTDRAANRPRRVFALTTDAPSEVKAATPTRSAPALTASHAFSPRPVRLDMPINGRITSNFGRRLDPINHRPGNHSGVDIAAPRGTKILSAARGTVVFSGREGKYGNTVLIEHPDGRRTRYAHADKLLVSAGDRVTRGQTIATVGTTGRTTGPHLHFEITEAGKRIDPLKTIAKEIALYRR